MGFGGEVYHYVDAFHQLPHKIAVLDSSLDKLMPGIIHHSFKILPPASIGQRIKVHYLVVRMFLQDVMNEVGANKASTASY